MVLRLLTAIRIFHSTSSGNMSFLTAYVAFGSTLTTFTRMVPSSFFVGGVTGTASLISLLACISGHLGVLFSLVVISHMPLRLATLRIFVPVAISFASTLFVMLPLVLVHTISHLLKLIKAMFLSKSSFNAIYYGGRLIPSALYC